MEKLNGNMSSSAKLMNSRSVDFELCRFCFTIIPEAAGLSHSEIRAAEIIY